MEAVARLVEGLVQEWTRSELPRLQARARRHWREAREGEWCGAGGREVQGRARSALPRLPRHWRLGRVSRVGAAVNAGYWCCARS